jgi:hypothetical protein
MTRAHGLCLSLVLVGCSTNASRDTGGAVQHASGAGTGGGGGVLGTTAGGSGGGTQSAGGYGGTTAGVATGGAAGSAGAVCDVGFVTSKVTPSAPQCDTQAKVKVAFGYALDALPSGACASEDNACRLPISEACCDMSAQDGGISYRTNGWSCVCDGGSWCCALTDQASTVCDCPP